MCALSRVTLVHARVGSTRPTRSLGLVNLFRIQLKELQDIHVAHQRVTEGRLGSSVVNDVLFWFLVYTHKVKWVSTRREESVCERWNE
jgi:hypothetical protein